MKRLTALSFLTLLVTLLGAASASAATYYSVASGNWNATSTWSTTDQGTAGAGPPIAGDTVYITRGWTVTNNVNNAACSTLTLGRIGGAAAGNGTLTFASSGSPALSVSVSVTLGGTSTTASTGTVTFTSGSSLTAGSLQLGNTTGTGVITMTAGGTLSVGGAITVGTASGTWTPGTGTVILTGTAALPATIFTSFNNLTINGGTTTLGVALAVGGNLTITSGTLDVSASNFGLSVAGNWVNNGTSFNARSGTVTLNGASAQGISGSTSTTFSSLTVNNTSGGVSLTASETVNGTLTLTSGAVTGAGNLTLGNGMTISRATGSLDVAPNFGTSVNVTYTAGGVTTGPELPTSAGVLQTLTIANTTGVVTLGAIQTAAALTINSGGGSFNDGGFKLTVTGNVSNSGTAASTLSGEILLTGGSGVHTLSSSGTGTYGNLELNDSNGATLSAAVIVSGNLTITVGTLTTANNAVTFNGNFVNNGTFTAGSSAITIGGGGTQSIAGFTTTGLVTMSKTGGTATLQGNVNGGAFTLNGSGGTLDLGSGLTHTFTGTFTRTAGTLNLDTSTLNINGSTSGTGGTWTPVTSTVNYGGSAQTAFVVNYYNLTLSGSGTPVMTGVTNVGGSLTLSGSVTPTLSALTNVTGTLSLSGTATATMGANLAIGGNLSIGNGTAFTAGAFALTVTGTTTVGNGTSGTLTLSSATGTKTFTGAVTISAGGTINESAAVNPTFTGGLTVNGTYQVSAASGYVPTATWNSGSTLSLTGGTGTLLGSTAQTFYNVTVNSAGTITLISLNAPTVAGTLTITAGTLADNGNVITAQGNVVMSGTESGAGGITLSGGSASHTLTGTGTYGILLLNDTQGATFNTSATVSGTLTIDAGDTLTLGAVVSPIFSGDVTINGNWNETAAVAPSFGGNLILNSGGSFTDGGGVHTFSGSSMQIKGTASSFTIGSLAVTGSLSLGGSVATLTVGSALSGAGSFTLPANDTLNIGGTSSITTLTATASGNTVNYSGATQTVHVNNYQNLTLSGSGTPVMTSVTNVGGNLTLSGSVTPTLSALTNVTGNLSIGNGTALTVPGVALTVTGTTTVGGGTSGTLTLSSATGTKTFTGDVTLASGSTWTESAAAVCSFGGNLILNGGSFTDGGGVHTFSGASKAIQGTASSFTIGSLAVTGSLSLSGSVATLTVGTALSGGGSFTLPANDTLNIGGTSTITTLTATASGNTVNYTGATQTVHVNNYQNLSLSGSGIPVMTGVTNVGGSLTLSGSVTPTLSALTNVTGTLSLSGTATATMGANLAIGGNLSMGNGTAFTAGAFALTVTGTTTVGGGTSGTLTLSSATGTKTFTGAVTISAGGTINESAAFNPTFTAGLTVNGTYQVSAASGYVPTATWNSGSTLLLTGGTGTLLGSTAQTFYNVTVNSSGNTITLPASSAPTVAGTLTITAGTLADNGNVITAQGNVVMSGTESGAGGITLSGGSAPHTLSGAGTYGILLLNDTQGATLNTAPTVSGTLTINSACTLTLGAVVSPIFSGDVTINGTWNETAAVTPSFGGNLILNSGGSFTASTGVHTFNVAGKSLEGTATSISIPSLTITSPGTLTLGGSMATLTVGTALGGTGSFTLPANDTLYIGGTSTITTLTATASGNTVNYSGAAQTVHVNNYQNLTLSGSGTPIMTGVTNVGGTLTLSGSVTPTLSSLTNVTGSLSLSGTATATMGANLAIGGNLSIGNGTIFASASTYTLGVTGTTTVGGGASGTFTLGGTGNGTFTGNVTISSGGTWNNSGNANVSLGGNFQDNGTFTAGTGTYTFNGAGAQTISGTSAPTFTGLTMNNAAGLTLSTSPTVNGQLTLTSGDITTGANPLILGASATVSGASINSYVNGTVQQTYTVGSVASSTFPIGDSTHYDPVVLTNLNITHAGVLQATTTAGDHPQIGSSDLDSNNNVNRYWTLTALLSLAGTYGGTFGYSLSSSEGTGTASAYVVRRWNGIAWSAVTINSTPTATATSFSGQSGFSDFAIGDRLLSQWIYRKTITIDHTKVGPTTDQANFPVLINLLSDSGLAAHAQANGFDLLFTASDGTTVLSYEREQYTSGTGALVAWVKVPTLSHTADTVLYLYYGYSNGGSSAPDEQDPLNTWDTNFKGVWHLKEPTGTTVVDSTVTGTNGTPVRSPTQTAGQIDGALSFNSDSGEYVNMANTPTPVVDNWTLEAWINPGALPQGTGTNNVAATFAVYNGTDGGGYGFGVGSGDTFGNAGSNLQGLYGFVGWFGGGYTFPSANAWYHVVLVRSGTASFYVNGNATATGISVGGLPPNAITNGFTIGCQLNPSSVPFRYFNGGVDEVRISNTPRSADWIATEYNSQFSPSTFYTVGPEQGSTTSTTAVSSPIANPSTYGQAVSFTAAVTGSGGTPTGTVQFQINGVSFGAPVALDVSGHATSLAISTLPLGTTPVTAYYSGNSTYSSSTGTLSVGQTVNPNNGDYRSAVTATGNWDAVGSWQTWNGSAWQAAVSVPNGAAGVAITITNGNTITLRGATNLLGLLVVNGTLGFSGSGALAVGSSGIVNNSNTISSSTSTLTFGSGATYQHLFATTAGTIPTASWNANSTCAIIGYTSNTGAPTVPASQTFGNFTWNCPSQTGGAINLGLPAGTTTIGGNFTVTSTGTRSVGLASSTSPTVNISGNLVVNAATLNFSTGSGAPTVTVTGNVQLNGGTLQPATSSGVPVFNVAGSWSDNGGTFTAGTGTVTFNGTGAQSIAGSTSTTFNGLTINKSAGTATLGINATASTFTMTLGTFDASTFLLTATTPTLTAGTLRVGAATWSANYSFTPTPPAGFTIEYYNANPTINAAITYQNLTFSGSGTAGASGALAIQGNLSNTGGGTLNFGANNVTLSGTVSANSIAGFTTTGTVSMTKTAGTATFTGAVTAGALTINGSGGTLDLGTSLSHQVNGAVTLTVGALNGDTSSLGLTGNWVNNGGTFTPSSSTVTFNNTSGAQAINGTAALQTFNNLMVAMSGQTLSVGANTTTLTLNGDLTLTSGTFAAGTATAINVAGNWSNNSSSLAFTAGGSVVSLTGAGKAIGGSASTTFAGLQINAGATYNLNLGATCSSLTFAAGATSSSLTHSGTTLLTVNGPVTINQPTAAFTAAWNINAGTATVSGLINFAGSSGTANLIGKVAITTGTLNANGGMTFVTSASANKVIDMSGGAGNLNLKGALTVPATSSTLTAGSTSTFNYADTAAQTINFFSSGAYNNLSVNNTGGATLSAAIVQGATPNVTGNLSVQTGTLNNGGFAITLASGKSFSVSSGATFNLTGTSTMVAVSGGGTKTFGTTSLVNYAGAAQPVTAETAPGYGNLTLSGSGTKTLPGSVLTVAGNFAMSGTASGTTAANINITGTANIGSGTTLTAPNNLSVGGATTVDGTLTLSGANTFTGGVALDAGGFLNLNSATALNGATFTINGGTINTSVGGPFTLSPDSLMNWNGDFTFTGTSSLNLGNGAVTLGATRQVTVTANNLTVGGVISGAFGLTKAGGGTLTLSGASTYTGLTTISAGVIKLGGAGSGANSPLGTIDAGTVVSAGAALDLNGFMLATAEPLTLNGTGIASGGALMNSSATAATYSGLITLGSASSIVSASGNIILTAAGTITGSGFGLTLDGTAAGSSLASIIGTGAGTLTKNGSGTWTLSGASTYTGATTVNAGTLQAGVVSVANTSGAFGNNSAVTMVNVASAVLNITSFATQIGSLTGGGTTGGSVTLGAATLTVGGDNTSPAAYAGAISGTGALTKIGSGTLTLSGNSSYSGLTTISAGVIKLAAAGSSPNGPLGTIAAGTVVSGTGAALDLNGITLGTAEPLTLNGTGIASGGALMNSSAGGATYTGLITLGSDSSIISGNGNIILNNAGPITGAGFDLILGGTATGSSLASAIGTTTGMLTKNGTGTWTLSGASTYTGATTVNGGTLQAGVASVANTSGAFGNNSAVTMANVSGAVLNITGFATQIGSLTGGGATGGNVTLGGATLTVGGDSTSPAAYAGVISGTGALTKIGSGTCTLSGANTYSGATTVNAGTLQAGVVSVANTSGAFGNNSAVTMANVASAVLNITGFNTQIGSLTGGGATGGNVTLGAATLTVGGDNTSPLAYAGVISGTGALTKIGTGTCILSGANIYTGATTVSAGTLQAGVVSVGGTSGAFGNNSAVTMANVSGAILNITGFATQIGSLTGGGGTGGNVTLGAATLTVGGDNTSPAAYAGVISGTGGALTKIGTGTLTLSGASTYTGLTTISAGVVNIQNASALGTVAGGTTVSSGAALQIQGGIAVGAEALTLNGTGIANDGALRNISGANSWAGAITLGTTGVRINSDASALTLSGGITGTGFALTVGGSGNTTISTTGLNTSTGGTLTKDGSGTLTISAGGSYTGLTTISAGVVNIQNATALGTVAGGTTVASGAALQIQGGIAVGAEALTLNGTGIANDGALRNISGANSWAGVITLGTASRINSDAGTLTINSGGNITGATFALTVGGAGNVTINDPIATTTGTLTKDGAGTCTLSGASTYTGATTVSAGTLQAGVVSVGGTSGAFGNNSAVTMVNVASAVLNITGFATQIGSLTGGGATGGNVTLGAATLTVGGDNTSPAVYAGVISGTGGVLTKIGSGTLTLSGNSTYSGGTVINAGTVSVGNVNDASGNQNLGSGGITFANGGTLLDTGSAAQSTAKAVTLNTGGGVITMTGGSITLTGNITGGGGLTTGGSDLILNRASGNNAIGAITVTSGRLFVYNPSTAALNSINGSSIAVQKGATLDFWVVGAVAPANTMTFASGSCLANRGSGTLTVSIPTVSFPTAGTMIFNQDDQPTTVITVNGATYPTLTGGLTIQVGGNNATVGTVTNNGAISGTVDAALTKTSTGTLVLTAANTYTGGTTVGAGTLEVQHDGGLGSSDVTVASGATLKLDSGSTHNYISDSASVFLNGSGNVNLVAALDQDTVGALFINGVRQVAGTWGNTGSGAGHLDSTHFAGLGYLSVAGLSVTQLATAGNAVSGTSISVTVPAGGVPVGNTVILSFAMDPSTGTVSATDSRGNPYTVDNDNNVFTDATTGVRTVVLSAQVLSALASGDTITVTFPTATAKALSACYVSDLVNASRDQTASGGSTTAATSGATASATTLYPNEVLIGAVGIENAASAFVAGGGYTPLTSAQSSSTPGSSSIEVFPEYAITNAIGSYTAGGSGWSSSRWAADLVTYRATVISTPTSIGQNNATAAGTTLAVTVSAAGVAVGNTIIVSFEEPGVAGTVSVSDTHNTYTSDADVTGSGMRTLVFSAPVTTALASGATITVTSPSAANRAVSVYYVGGLLSPSRDQVQTGSGSSTAPSSGATATTTQANELLWGAIGFLNSGTFTAGSSFSALTPATAASAATIQPTYQIVGATGSYTASGTLGTSGGWAAAIVTYKMYGSTPPTGGTHYLATTVNTPLSVKADALVALDYDSNSNPLTITAVSTTSTNGPSSNVAFDGVTITYTPANNFVGADQFTYTISDGFGGSATSTAQVTVNLGKATSLFISISGTPGNIHLRGYGIPLKSYDIQYSPDMSNWTTLTTVAAAASGVILYTDTNGSDSTSGFYRFAVH